MDPESNKLLPGRQNFALPRLSRRRFLSFVAIPQQHILVFCLVTVPLFLNLCLLIHLFGFGLGEQCRTPPSDYAGLRTDKTIYYQYETDFWMHNDDVSDKLWSSLPYEVGYVALENSYVEEKGLPQAMPIPWDHSKGFYVINGYHKLHCLNMLYRSVAQSHRGLNQSGSYTHLTHCLDWIRQDTICEADDTPLATRPDPDKSVGIGNYRKCRNFDELDAWVKDRTSCWKDPHPQGRGSNWHAHEKFKYCPDDSPLLPQVRDYYNLPADWLPSQEDYGEHTSH